MSYKSNYTGEQIDEAIESVLGGDVIVSEADPTVPSHVKAITTEDIARWNEGGSGKISNAQDTTVPIYKVTVVSQDYYDSLSTKAENTLYFIRKEE